MVSKRTAKYPRENVPMKTSKHMDAFLYSEVLCTALYHDKIGVLPDGFCLRIQPQECEHDIYDALKTTLPLQPNTPGFPPYSSELNNKLLICIHKTSETMLPASNIKVLSCILATACK